MAPRNRSQQPITQVAIALLATAAIVIALVLACSSEDGPPHTYAPDFTLEDARDFKPFGLYWIGEEFQGHTRGNLSNANGLIVTISYGDCDVPADQTTCGIPISLNMRHYCGFTLEDAGAVGIEEIRGAAVNQRAGQAFVWTGDTAITINGENFEQTREIVQSLVSLTPGGPETPEQDLGPPIDTDCRR